MSPLWVRKFKIFGNWKFVWNKVVLWNFYWIFSIRNNSSYMVRSTLLHLSSLAGPTGNSGDSEISRDLGTLFEIPEESKDWLRDVADLGMVVHISIDLLMRNFLWTFFKMPGKKIETCPSWITKFKIFEKLIICFETNDSLLIFYVIPSLYRAQYPMCNWPSKVTWVCARFACVKLNYIVIQFKARKIILWHSLQKSLNFYKSV